MSSNGNVLQCRGDVDTPIVSIILDFSCAEKNVCLIAADTDLLIMLIYMWNYMMGQIKLQSEGTRKYKVSVRDIRKITSTLGDIQKFLTFIRAFGGYDTTCHIRRRKAVNIRITFEQKQKKKFGSSRSSRHFL